MKEASFWECGGDDALHGGCGADGNPFCLREEALDNVPWWADLGFGRWGGTGERRRARGKEKKACAFLFFHER